MHLFFPLYGDLHKRQKEIAIYNASDEQQVNVAYL